MVDRISQYKEIQEEALDLFTKKNADYGDAFSTYGVVGILIRMGDKIQRLSTVTNTGVTFVSSENLRDTLIDLHNYAAMAMMLIDQKKVKKIRSRKKKSLMKQRKVKKKYNLIKGGRLRNTILPRQKDFHPKPSNYFTNGQKIEILSDHNGSTRIYNATVWMPRPGENRKMKVCLDDGMIFYMNVWTLKLKQAKANRVKKSDPLNKKWYL